MMTTYTKLFTTIIFVFVSVVCCFGQNVTITTQAEMDAFDPNTTVINGNLEINGNNSNDPITNLNNFSSLTSISGDLSIIYNNSLENIDVFFNLTSIGGNLRINNNATLTNIDAFSNLTSISGNLNIQGNTILTNIGGLSNLTFVTGNVNILSNNSLANIDGLSSVTSIGGYLVIASNTTLINIDGLSNVTSIAGPLTVDNNNGLTNIDGLTNLTSINESLWIRDNNSLTNIDGLTSLTSIDGSLFIRGNLALTNINGLSNLVSINGSLTIDNCFLTNIDGLSNLTFISGSLGITANTILTNVDGLLNLNSIGGNLYVESNEALTNIEGLSNLSSIVGSVSIEHNTVLTDIGGLSNLSSIPGSVSIESNAALTSIGDLSNLISISEYLSIRNNIALINLDDLPNLAYIGGGVAIRNNAALTNIDGLSNVSSLDGDLEIENSAALMNIDGLSNLTYVLGDVSITNNATLTNIDGLSNLASIASYLIITDNDNLANCCGVQNLLDTPEAIYGGVSIYNNPFQCSNQNQVLNTFCGVGLKIFNDLNQDCIKDNNEFGIANRMFIIQPGNIIGETNPNGYWFIDSLPIGDYTITIDTSGTWSPTCAITQPFTISDPFEDTVVPTFGLVSTEPCTAPDISIHMPFMRPCFEDQRIYMQACNTSDATGALEDTYIVLELDPLLIPTSSSIPYADLGNNMYQFDIGTLNPGICSEFWMETTLSCDAVLGQSLCMEANLFPADECVFDDIPNDTSTCNTAWDMSSLEVEGDCENGVIVFEITNSGSGDMTCFSPVRIYINGNLITLDSVQLVSGEVATFSFSGDGQSWRLEANQHPLHPGNSQPNAVVEGCGGTVASLLSLTNEMYLDDADPIVDIYCGTVTGSYDPNDKTGFPLGINASNDILPNQQMEYLIRFQNTGTDTAFTVVIRDTLSTDFDIFSVESGVASHSYDFEMYGPRVMQWTFNNILLPDSTTNESDSHGFIKFKVNQIPDLSEGTILENSAGIYFDFNEPIITNTSEHTINYFTPNFVTTNVSEEVCETYTSPSGNNIWTNSGTYYDVIETTNGDSIIIVDLLVLNSLATITGIEGNTLMANIPDAEYQWLDCNNNFEPIVGATSQEFTTTETIGNYAVQITLNECQLTSDCYNLNTTGIENNEFISSVGIYPNPTSNYVTVDLGKNYQGVSLTLRNILGETLFKKNVNNTNQFQFEINEAIGVYLLQIETERGQSATFKILKK